MVVEAWSQASVTWLIITIVVPIISHPTVSLCIYFSWRRRGFVVPSPALLLDFVFAKLLSVSSLTSAQQPNSTVFLLTPALILAFHFLTTSKSRTHTADARTIIRQQQHWLSYKILLLLKLCSLLQEAGRALETASWLFRPESLCSAMSQEAKTQGQHYITLTWLTTDKHTTLQDVSW